MRHVPAIALGALLLVAPADSAARASASTARVPAVSRTGTLPDVVLIVSHGTRGSLNTCAHCVL